MRYITFLYLPRSILSSRPSSVHFLMFLSAVDSGIPSREETSMKVWRSNSSGRASRKSWRRTVFWPVPAGFCVPTLGRSLNTRAVCSRRAFEMAIAALKSSSRHSRSVPMEPSSIVRTAERIMAMRKVMRPRRRTEAMISSPRSCGYSRWTTLKYALKASSWAGVRWKVISPTSRSTL